MLQYNQGAQSESDAHLESAVNPRSTMHPLVESYLGSLFVPTTSAREEMRVHIESLIEANIELGDSMDLAIEHALEQFGSSSTVQREWRRTCPPPDSMKRSVLTALRLNAAGSLAAGVALPLSFRIGNEIGWHGLRIIGPISLLVAPFAAGLITSIIVRHRPILSTLCASLLLLPMSTLDSILSRTIGDSVMRIPPDRWGFVLLVGTALACTGAGIGSLARWLKHGPRRIVIAW
jgi:hypothetical protein